MQNRGIEVKGSVNSLLRIRLCYFLRVLGIFLYSWAAVLIVTFLRSLLHGLSFLSFSFWSHTFMGALCLTLSSIPLFWTTQPKSYTYATMGSNSSQLLRWIKIISLRFMFVLLSGCATFFASGYIGQALKVPFASFYAKDIISIKFSCFGIFSGIIVSISFWIQGKFTLQYDKQPNRMVEKYWKIVKDYAILYVIVAFCSWLIWGILGSLLEEPLCMILDRPYISMPISFTEYMTILFNVVCIQLVQMFCFNAVVISLTHPVDFVSPVNAFNNEGSSVELLLEAVTSKNEEAKMAGFFALSVFTKDGANNKELINRTVLTQLFDACSNTIIEYNDSLASVKQPPTTVYRRSLLNKTPRPRPTPLYLPKNIQTLHWAIESVDTLVTAGLKDDEFKFTQRIDTVSYAIQAISNLSSTLDNIFLLRSLRITKKYSPEELELVILNDLVKTVLQDVTSTYDLRPKNAIPIDQDVRYLLAR